MKNFLLLFFATLLLTCHRTPSEGATTRNINEKSTPTDEVALPKSLEEEKQEDPKEIAARMQGKNQKLKAPNPLGQIPATLGYKTPQQLCKNKYGCLKEMVFPIGWSKDGKFAYCIEYPIEAEEMYRMDFFIQDLKTDEMVDQASFKGETTQSLANIWQAKNLDFIEDLSKHNIEIINDRKLQSFPLKWGENSLTLTIDNRMVMSDYSSREVVAESKISISGSGHEPKQIAQKAYGKYDLTIATEVLGYLKSPFEDRIVVVYVKEKRGFEGPPNILSFSFIGCSLVDL